MVVFYLQLLRCVVSSATNLLFIMRFITSYVCVALLNLLLNAKIYLTTSTISEGKAAAVGLDFVIILLSV